MLTPGSKFAHFEILSELGRGGMGTVYLARDSKLARQVALKILSAEIFDDQEHRERFHREARTAAQVSHPNVMAIHDIGTAPEPKSGKELNYIVMEYVKGLPLSNYLAANKLDVPACVRLAEKIAAGLAAAHQMNIVHRDIKPENIIVSESKSPKILDFGLAKPVDPVQLDGPDDSTNTISQELTKAGKILGTVKYMSPEQVQGKPVDHRSDIFSFGILMYIILSGETPFAGDTMVSTMAKILETKHPSIVTKNPVLPPEVERIIDKCLAKDPADRYQDTRDLVVDLRNLRRQFDSGVTSSYSGITARPTRLEKSWTGKALWRPITGVAITLMVMAYLLGGIDIFINTDQGAEVKAYGTSLAIIGFDNKTGDESLAWMETGLPEIILTDLSQGLGLQIISQQRILDCFEADRRTKHTVTECSEAAKHLGASKILSGSFFKLGDKLRIDARLEDIASGTVILAEKVVGDDPFELVNSLTAKIAASLELEGLTQASIKPASSPEAFKEYHLGMEFFWANDFDSSIASFERAIEIDSSYAMPYMRIGMAHIWSGRAGEGAHFMREAAKHRKNLPSFENNMLDIYIDTWVDVHYDRAFNSLSRFVRDYPDDAEIRTIYALFINVFKKDTVAAFAQLDTVLATYPSNAFALGQYANMLRNNGNLDRAEEMVLRLNNYMPNSMYSQTTLIRLRSRQGKFDEATSLAKKLHAQFPEDNRPLERLVSLSFNLHKAANARKWATKIKELDPENPYTLTDYYQYLINADLWEGHFEQAKINMNNRYKQAMVAGDSILIFTSLNGLSDYYHKLDQLDSMMIWETKAYAYAIDYNKISYVFSSLHYDPALASKVRPIFDSITTDFKAKMPREIWGIVEAHEIMFEGIIKRDTAMMIESYKQAVEVTTSTPGQTTFELGRLLILFGEYASGVEYVEPFVGGQYRTSNADLYLTSLWLLGRGYEGLGETSKAIEKYEEFLMYWGNADIQLESIRDAKERLAKLSS